MSSRDGMFVYANMTICLLFRRRRLQNHYEFLISRQPMLNTKRSSCPNPRNHLNERRKFVEHRRAVVKGSSILAVSRALIEKTSSNREERACWGQKNAPEFLTSHRD
jgi:hypothetical protein